MGGFRVVDGGVVFGGGGEEGAAEGGVAGGGGVEEGVEVGHLIRGIWWGLNGYGEVYLWD